MNFDLDFSEITTRSGLHDYLTKMLDLPAYYGRNLDALYDLLSTWGQEATVKILSAEKLEENLGGYGAALLATLQEAEQSNPKIHIEIG